MICPCLHLCYLRLQLKRQGLLQRCRFGLSSVISGSWLHMFKGRGATFLVMLLFGRLEYPWLWLWLVIFKAQKLYLRRFHRWCQMLMQDFQQRLFSRHGCWLWFWFCRANESQPRDSEDDLARCDHELEWARATVSRSQRRICVEKRWNVPFIGDCEGQGYWNCSYRQLLLLSTEVSCQTWDQDPKVDWREIGKFFVQFMVFSSVQSVGWPHLLA